MKNSKKLLVLLAVLLVFSFTACTALACTEVFIKSGQNVLVSARNFDFINGRGFIRFSQAGEYKYSQLSSDGKRALGWLSKYPSISFNTYFDKPGPEKGSSFYIAGVDGINIEGFKVGTYFLDNSSFPDSPTEKTIDVGSFMQYLLDNFKSVDEAIRDIESNNYQVTSLPTGALDVKLHFFLHDITGKSAIVEFIRGRTNIIYDPEIPVLTNSPYLGSIEYIKAYEAAEGKDAVPGGKESLDRFVRAAFYSKHLPTPQNAEEAVKNGFSVMQPPAVSPGFDHGFTQWTIVTDIKSKRAYFRTYNGLSVAFIDLEKVAATSKASSDIDLLRTDLNGDISGMFTPSEEFDPAGAPPAPDYSDKSNWISLPASTPEKAVDVFFVHPTTYFFPNTWNESIAFAKQNPKVTAGINNQASVFSSSCNVYAPHYRDAHIKVLGAPEKSKNGALNLAYKDVERAFDHYITHFNHNKPFILAGHSQGSNLLLWLLQRKFSDPELQKRLVASYIIGWSVTADDIKSHSYIKISRDPKEIGAVITYNTQTVHPEKTIVRPGAIGVNPLTMDDTLKMVSKQQHLGAVFFTDKGIIEIPNYTGAQTVNGALTVPCNLESEYVHTSSKGFYHSYDYNIFYRNIENDVLRRIKEYFKKNQ